MTLNVLEDARRELRAMMTLFNTDRLGPSEFKTLHARLAHRLDEIGFYLEEAGPMRQDQVIFEGRDGRVGLPLASVTFHGHLSVIEGGRQQ